MALHGSPLTWGTQGCARELRRRSRSQGRRGHRRVASASSAKQELPLGFRCGPCRWAAAVAVAPRPLFERGAVWPPPPSRASFPREVVAADEVAAALRGAARAAAFQFLTGGDGCGVMTS